MENEKKKTAPDKDQQKAIDARINSVVSAGAGSGKTTVLSQRFLNLIQKDRLTVDRILTLTFTKKATVEMSDRIYKVLKENAPDQAALFYKSSIKTLDSYCSSVAKLGAHFYGISPDFTQDDDTVRNQIEALALPFILKNRDNPTIRKLAGTNGFDSFADAFLVDPMMNNSKVTAPIDFEACIQKQLNEAERLWKVRTSRLQEAVSRMEDNYKNYEGSTGTATWKKFQDFFEGREFPEIPVLRAEDIRNGNLSLIRDFMLQAADYNGTPKARNLKNTDGWSDTVDVIKDAVSQVINVYTYAAGFHMILELVPLMEEFQHMVNSFKRTAGILTFKDISALALTTLLEHPEIRRQEKLKYDAIMIDEFQDNNSDQKDMLFLLAEREDRMEKSLPDVSELCPDKLFFVGDEKQSIYRFRGADVSVFRGLSQCFMEGNLSMATNYRSHTSLIAAFNTIFGGIKFPGFSGGDNADMLPSVFYTDSYPEICKDVPDYEAVYHEVTVPESKLKEITPENFTSTYVPHVHLALFDNDAPEDERYYLTKENAETEWVCRKIEQLMSDPDDPVNPSDIAILIPKLKNLQPRLEKALLLHGIPYNTETVTDLFSDGPVNDLSAFIKLCVYPEDRMAYAHILRSCFVNLSIRDVNILLNSARAFSDTDAKTGIKLTDSISEKAAERFYKAAAFYEKVSQSAKEEPLTGTVSKLWMESGYRFETMWNHTVEMFSKQYDLLFEIARQCDARNMGIAGFADYLAEKKQAAGKIDNMDIPFEQAEGVHIMSIHKSKGLEFDHVFVFSSYSGTNKSSDNQPVYVDPEYGITLKVPATADFPNVKKNLFFDSMKETEIRKNNAEARRKAYVALTRAKKELYITGKWKSKETYDNTWSKFSYSGKMEITNVFDTMKPVFLFYLENGVTRMYPGQDSHDGGLQTATSPMPFDAEMIPSYPRTEIVSREHRQNTSKARTELVEALKNDNPYSKARLIEMDMPAPKYITPSHLHDADDETPSTATDTGSSPDTENQDKQVFSYNIDKSIPYWDISDIVLRSIPKNTPAGTEPEPKFNFADFGTVAHAFMEASVTGADPELPEKLFAGLEDRTADIRRVKEICREMAENFKKSSLGQEVHECIEAGRFIKAEYEFRSRTSENQIVRGIIDLVYQNPDGTFTVVDYKTNQVMEPEIYYGQLACYRQAVADMMGIEDASTVKCRLYYLRFGETVDISDRIQ